MGAASLRLAHRVTTPAIARRAGLLAALVFVERLLLPLAAWAFLGAAPGVQLALAIALGAILSGRTFVQHLVRARCEADLLERVVRRLVGGDVLRSNVLAEEDARAELAQAVYHAAQVVSAELPTLAADVAAASILGVVVLAREPLRVAAAALGLALAAAATLAWSRRAMSAALTSAWVTQRSAHDGMVDAIEGRLDIVASGQAGPFLAGFRERVRAWSVAGSQLAREALVAHRVPVMTVAGLLVLSAVVSGSRWRGALGMSATEVALLASIAPAFAGMAQHAVALARAQKWMAVVVRVLDEPRAAAGGARPPPLRPDAIALDHVSFRYAGAPNEALVDVSFRWTGGVLGLTGANGSGKSTCLRLLLGLAFADRGSVTVDGVALSELDLEAWRCGIAFLPQRPYFPPRSDVREAIRFLVPGAADEAMREALQRSGAWSLLDPRGGDPLAVRLDTLSVGGRQRVGLARLLCKKATLVLLDEPDANLDRAGIARVARLVRELSDEARVAIVAHSPELLEVVDRTLVLDRGRIVEDRGGPSAGGR